MGGKLYREELKEETAIFEYSNCDKGLKENFDKVIRSLIPTESLEVTCHDLKVECKKYCNARSLMMISVWAVHY